MKPGLGSLGWEALVASRGDMALELLVQFHPDWCGILLCHFGCDLFHSV